MADDSYSDNIDMSSSVLVLIGPDAVNAQEEGTDPTSSVSVGGDIAQTRELTSFVTGQSPTPDQQQGLLLSPRFENSRNNEQPLLLPDEGASWLQQVTIVPETQAGPQNPVVAVPNLSTSPSESDKDAIIATLTQQVASLRSGLSPDILQAQEEARRNLEEIKDLYNAIKRDVDTFLKGRKKIIKQILAIGRKLKKTELGTRIARILGVGTSALGHSATTVVCIILVAGVMVPIAAPVVLTAAGVGVAGQATSCIASTVNEWQTSAAVKDVEGLLDNEDNIRTELKRNLKRLEQRVKRNAWLEIVWTPVVKAIKEEEAYMRNVDWLKTVEIYDSMVADNVEMRYHIDWDKFLTKAASSKNILLQGYTMASRIPVGFLVSNVSKATRNFGFTVVARVEISFALAFSFLGVCLDILELRSIIKEFKTTGNGDKIIQIAEDLERKQQDFQVEDRVESPEDDD